MPQENNLLRRIQVINHSYELKNIFVKKLLTYNTFEFVTINLSPILYSTSMYTYIFLKMSRLLLLLYLFLDFQLLIFDFSTKVTNLLECSNVQEQCFCSYYRDMRLSYPSTTIFKRFKDFSSNKVKCVCNPLFHVTYCCW